MLLLRVGGPGLGGCEEARLLLADPDSQSRLAGLVFAVLSDLVQQGPLEGANRLRDHHRAAGPRLSATSLACVFALVVGGTVHVVGREPALAGRGAATAVLSEEAWRRGLPAAEVLRSMFGPSLLAQFALSTEQVFLGGDWS
jgi:hypothetical protein